MKYFFILFAGLSIAACSSGESSGESVTTDSTTSVQTIQDRSAPSDQTDSQDKDIGESSATTAVSAEANRAKTSRHLKKWNAGINFHAMGNEPSWNLDIDFDRGMQFSTMDGFELQTPMGTPGQERDGEVRQYHAITESGELIVELNNSNCSDAMSGEPFDYQISVKVKESGATEFRSFKGCGEYVVDPRLHNIWIVEQFQGDMIDHDLFARGIPQIEINVRDDNYMGHDGCNSIRGAVSLTNTRITFASGPSTLMACDENISQKISMELVNGPLDFSFDGGRLELSRNGTKIFVLKNVD